MSEGQGILEEYVEERTAALEEQRQILHAIIECLNEGVVVVDKTRGFVVSNSIARDKLGLDHFASTHSDSQRGVSMLLPEGASPCPPDELPLSRALRGEVVANVELQLWNPVIPDGKLVAISARPWFDSSGNVRGAIRVGHDLTEMKTSEEALAQCEVRLRRVLEAAHDAFIEMNDAGVVSDWTRQSELTFGWTGREKKHSGVTSRN
jgi:PAS domain-containing protein